MSRLPTYYMSHKEEIQNILNEDHKLLKAKYEKLAKLHSEIGNRVAIAEKQAKIAENTATKAEAALKAANFTISADTDELRIRMIKEHEKRKELFEAQIKSLYATIKNNTKLFERLKRTEEAIRDDLLEVTKKFKNNENEVTTLNNRLEAMRGKFISARNKIVALNANTPYRPGMVERTIKDVLEDLKNV